MPKNFTDLEIWRLGKELAVDIFKMWESIDSRGFFGLRDQMQRAAVSISSNIAEGSERRSAPDYVRFLYISKGSVAELRTQLTILGELKISDDVQIAGFIERTEILSRKIQRLISVICEGKNK